MYTKWPALANVCAVRVFLVENYNIWHDDSLCEWENL